MRKYLIITICAMLSSCSVKNSDKELAQECETGVVMVLNRYYYQIQISDGNFLYFTGFTDEGDFKDLTMEKEEIIKSPAVISGTGFFMNSTGAILTNRHVVRPQIDERIVKQNYRKLINNIKNLYSYLQYKLSEEMDSLENQRKVCSLKFFFGDDNYMDQIQLNAIQIRQNEISSSYSEVMGAIAELNTIDLNNVEISSVCEIGIAYNDTYISTVNDAVDKYPCVVTKISENADVDLARIQLKDKKTPQGRHVFRLYEDREKLWDLKDKIIHFFAIDDSKGILELNDKVYMIGFNAGPMLGNTKEGLKAQFNSGTVTQQPDGERVLYSIPVLQGASGSPVLDEAGNLVAVNFAKFGAGDNFSFGIPANKIKAFLNQ